jgi:hypothetical protein
VTANAIRWRNLCDRVGATWGARAQWEIEMTTAIASEILDRSREAEDHVWEAAIAEVLGGPPPPVRSLPRLIAAALRRHVADARQLRPTLTVDAPETPYTRALAALAAGPCPSPAA